MEDYKEDIINTRKGCLGGSDAKMLDSIATMGYVPRSAYKRLAVCKGLIDQPQFTTKEMRFGDFVEMQVFNHLHESDNRWQSNPCLVSKKYSRPNVKCIDHVDLMLMDEEKECLIVGEVKASKDKFDEVRHCYKAQLMHHKMLATERAKELGWKKNVKVYLCHYDTYGLDLTKPFEFDIKRLTIRSINFNNFNYDLDLAMDIVDDFLSTFDVYYEGDEIPSELLPANVQDEFNAVTAMLNEIKEREKKVEDFKSKLCSFMQEKGIKSIKNDVWNITYVQSSESASVDYKTMFANEIQSKHPRVAKKLQAKYKKVTKKKPYVTIKLKGNND